MNTQTVMHAFKIESKKNCVGRKKLYKAFSFCSLCHLKSVYCLLEKSMFHSTSSRKGKIYNKYIKKKETQKQVCSQHTKMNKTSVFSQHNSPKKDKTQIVLAQQCLICQDQNQIYHSYSPVLEVKMVSKSRVAVQRTV